MYNACRVTPEPVNNNTFWEIVGDGRLCSIYSLGGRKCSIGQICGNPDEFGMTKEMDDVYLNMGI
jgi:hypothetical protein